MANNPLMIRKAFLATRNVSSGEFLMIERFESESGQAIFYLIDTPSEKNGKILQKLLQSEMIKSFLSSPVFTIRNLEECLHFINKKIASIGDFSSSEMNALVGLLDGATLHLSMTGNIEGYLLRKNKINSLTEGLDTNDEAGFLNITSGDLFNSDLVVIGNKNIFNRLSLDRIRKTLNQLNPRQAVREFYQILRRSKFLDCNVAIFQAVLNESHEKEDESLPDLIYLDEIVESNLSKAYKKYKTIADSYYLKAKQAAGRIAGKSQELAQRSGDHIKNNYAPKTKDALAKTNSLAVEKITKLSSSLKNSNALKVKPYNKKSSSGNAKWAKYLSSIFRIVCDKKNRRYLYLALVLVLVFAAYGKIRYNNQNREVIKKQNDASYAYDKAVETFNSAKEDMGLGKSDGLDKLVQALDLSKTAMQSNDTKDKAATLTKDIQAKIDTITKTTRILDPKPLFTFKYDIVTSVVSGSVIFGITGDGKIYSTESSEKDPKLIAAVPSELGHPIASTYSDKSSEIYILTDKSKIYAFDEQSQSGEEATIDDGSNWESAVALSSYSGYLYLLDSQNGKIWRHSSSSGSKFTAGKTYASSKNTDAKDGISIAIDGAIFVLKPQGSVVKFSHNIPDTSFVLQSPPKPTDSLTGASQLYTDADSQHIFILDGGQERLLRYAKDGQFVNQYALDGVNIKHMLYNPRIQKLWLLSERNVYEIDL